MKSQIFISYADRLNDCGSIFLKREEATNLLREIFSTCNGIDERTIMLKPPHKDDSLSHGYQLLLKSDVSQESLQSVTSVAKKHNLALANNQEDLIVIYRPFIGTEASLPKIEINAASTLM